MAHDEGARDADEVTLAAVLGEEPPADIASLPEGQRLLLAGAIGRMLDDHRRELRRATEESLRHVPRMVRPAIRKIVGL